MAVIFIEEGVTLRMFQNDEPKRFAEEPQRGDYIADPDEPLVLNPDERWASYVVYPFEKK